MKLLYKQFWERLSHYCSAFHRITTDNLNLLLVLISCIILYAEVIVSLDYDNINKAQAQELIIISLVLGLQLASYIMKRVELCGVGIAQVFEMCVTVCSMEIFFTVDKCNSDIYLFPLLQFQCIISNKSYKKSFTNYFLFLSFNYFALRYYLNLPSYSTQSLLTASLKLFFLFSGLVLAFYAKTQERSIDHIDKLNGEQMQQKGSKLISIYKNSNNMSTKSFFNSKHTKQQKKNEADNLLKPQTQTLLPQPSSFSNRQYNDEENQLNHSQQIQAPVILSQNKQRESELESILFSYREPSNEQNIFKQLQGINKAKHEVISNQTSNFMQINSNEECFKSPLPGNQMNLKILSELSIGMVILDDQHQILFSNDRSMQILKEGNSSNLMNKLYEYVTYFKGRSGGGNVSSQNNNNTIYNSKSTNEVKNSSFVQDLFEEKQSKYERKTNNQSMQRLTSICLRDTKDEELSPLNDFKKKKTDQILTSKKESSGKLHSTSLKDIIFPSTILQDTTKLTKIFSGNINGVDDKLTISDYKEEMGINYNPQQQRSQYGYKLSINPSYINSPTKSNILNNHSQTSEVRKSEIRRLNINLNKELHSLLRLRHASNANLKQIFDILLEAGNYKSIDNINNNNNYNNYNNNNNYHNINGIIKSKSEQMIDSVSTESKYFIKKSDQQTKRRGGGGSQEDQMVGSTFIQNRNDTDNIQEESEYYSKEMSPHNCFIKDNNLIIKAKKGNDVIDLKVSVLLEISTVYDASKPVNVRESGSGDATVDFFPDRFVLSNQRLEKFRESIEEFKLQQQQQQFQSQHQQNIIKGSSYFCSSLMNDGKNEKSKKMRKKVKNCDIKLFLIIEIYDKKEETKQINKEVFKDFKNRILSSLSHELRTPLNCSLQMLETLFHSDLLTDNQKKMLILPALNSNYLLLSMINDILDFAQLINGGLNLQFHEFNIVDLLRECMSYFTLQAAHKNIYMELNFEKNLPLTIRSDSMRMKQVIINLLSNSIKFTSQGQISINVDLEEKDLIKITIADTGCGIPPEVGNKIFKGLEFNQNNTQFNTEGAGMGLTIANNISKGLSGNRPIQFTSQLTKGSSFSFCVLDRPSKIKGCKSTKFTIFNRSFTNWKPLFQESSEKIAPSTVFDQITQNNNRIIGSNSMLPNTAVVPPSSNLLLQSQHSQYCQQHQIVKSRTFSNSSLPQKSFADFNTRIVNYINQNSNINSNNNNIINNTNNNQQHALAHPVASQNHFKKLGISCSEEQIPSFNSIPKSFQDLSFAKNSINNDISLASSYQQNYNQDQNYQFLDQQINQRIKRGIRFPSQGNINTDHSIDNTISRYQLEQNNNNNNNNIRKNYEVQRLQQQSLQPQQVLIYKNSSSKNIKGASSLRKLEEGGGCFASKISCEVETETSITKNYNYAQINQTHFIVGHKKGYNSYHNKYAKQGMNQKDDQMQEVQLRESTNKSDKNYKQICYTDEPPSVYVTNQNRDEYSNKHISPQQTHSLRTLLNDTFSLNEQKQQRQLEDDNSQQYQLSHNQNQSNKNSTNQLVQSSNNSKNHVRIKDLEIDDIQTNLQYFLSLQQSSHISHMYASNTNFQQPAFTQYIHNQNNNNNNNCNCSSPKNPSLLINSLTMQSNLSQNLNQAKAVNTSMRQVDSPRNTKLALHQVQNNTFTNLQHKLQKKVDGQSFKVDTNSQTQLIPANLSMEEIRQRVDSTRSKKQESQNHRMENIIESHENQEVDDNSHHSENNRYNSYISSQQIVSNNNIAAYDQTVCKQKIIQKNKQKLCNCSDVLIVDDNEFNLFALEMRLKQYAFIVETANSGLLGQQKVIQRHQESKCCHNFTLIFMDLDMPIQNGFQTTVNIIHYFKQEKQKPPIISACTAFVQDAERRKAKQVGMKYYLTKPVETSSLEKIISKILFSSP